MGRTIDTDEVRKEYEKVLRDCASKLDEMDRKYGVCSRIIAGEDEVTSWGSEHREFMHHFKFEIVIN